MAADAYRISHVIQVGFNKYVYLLQGLLCQLYLPLHGVRAHPGCMKAYGTIYCIVYLPYLNVQHACMQLREKEQHSISHSYLGKNLKFKIFKP